ncbi:FecCD family ABC transporter permease [Achromobacter xylosoxidans]|uniref:FecCD family ABC transporter permease n=1 Tax=Achromobacter TaxID=222 RepID=UPI0003D65A51|nr:MULTISPECIES: iron ABC transporter permease [Achromobacter]AHC48701.1 Vitamin B12 ABC transporter, permease component BtuC [Achromobacter xylosoxidans NBRC 15126 = ATCC 27061]MCH4583719.1 iron ABC transporter permease [Achromobacter xylosoxidans]CKH88319.1 Probable ABC transporter permease protein HI_1471 [Achromobacter xylosoxidans]CUI29281.1 Probable ABC transporter permease protein HI_1471 [Achromobacter xylosoxidans]SQG76367.1 Probable ABC transporter permease protein HI_1471 [Achromoba
MTACAESVPLEAGVARRRLAWPWLLMALALPASMLAALCVGRYPLPLAHVSSVLAGLALPDGLADWLPAVSGAEQRVVLQVRLPRVLLSVLAGSSLALCGAALQGAFRNPLVGPQILGISSGAAFGGCAAILLFSSLWATLGLAFAGGLLAVAIVYLLGRTQGRATILMLVLAGVVTSAFFSALISLATYFADPNDSLPAIVFWLMGSFATASYVKLAAAALPIAAGMGLLYALRFRINVLSLGDEQASAMGIAVEPLRWLLLGCATLVVSASVAVSGTVGWVGLVVPHIARMLVGPDHRALLPASALIGGTYMVWVDTVARSATSAEIPLGVITALIGAPLFAWLLRRTQGGGAHHA